MRAGGAVRCRLRPELRSGLVDQLGGPSIVRKDGKRIPVQRVFSLVAEIPDERALAPSAHEVGDDRKVIRWISSRLAVRDDAMVLDVDLG